MGGCQLFHLLTFNCLWKLLHGVADHPMHGAMVVGVRLSRVSGNGAQNEQSTVVRRAIEFDGGISFTTYTDINYTRT